MRIAMMAEGGPQSELITVTIAVVAALVIFFCRQIWIGPGLDERRAYAPKP
jgi:hypothetical protein